LSVDFWSSLIILSLSHSWTLRVFWITLVLDQERQRRQDEAKIKQGKVGSSSYNRLHCRYLLACVFSLLNLEFMRFHVVLSYHGMGFCKCDSIFSITLPFLNSFDKKGSPIQFMWDGQIGFEIELGGYPNLQTHGLSGP